MAEALVNSGREFLESLSKGAAFATVTLIVLVLDSDCFHIKSLANTPVVTGLKKKKVTAATDFQVEMTAFGVQSTPKIQQFFAARHILYAVTVQ